MRSQGYGLPGQRGPAGVAGSQGLPGAKGDQGERGVAGPKGDTGPTGATGNIGATGSVGAPGAKGDTGAAGVQGAQGPVGPTGPIGSTGAKGEAGATGVQGPAGFSTVTPTISTRAIGTAFQPHASKATRVSYSIRTQVTNPLLVGSSIATVTLLSDASNPPTTERARVSAESTVGLAVSIALTTVNVAPLSYLVPAGHYVRLVSTVTGTGATSIVSQVEEVLG